MAILNKKISDFDRVNNIIGDEIVPVVKNGENQSVTINEIADFVLPNSSVTSDKLATGSVKSGKIEDNAVLTSKINNRAVTSEKIAVGGVKTANIEGSSVTNPKLAINSVSTDKIQYAAVTKDKIGNGEVTVPKLSEGVMALFDECKEDTKALLKPIRHDVDAALGVDVNQTFTTLEEGFLSVPDDEPRVLFADGTPQASIVPYNWLQFDPTTGRGCNWNGEPLRVGDEYYDRSVTPYGHYIADRKSWDANSNNYFVLEWKKA